MNRRRLGARDWVLLVVVSIGIGVGSALLLRDDFGPGSGDNPFWSVLPWVLLVLLWAGFGLAAWRQHRREGG